MESRTIPGERLAQWRRLAREQVIGAFHDRDVPAEPTHRLRHLHTDRPPAQDEQVAGHGLHPGRLAVGPDSSHLSQPGDRWHERIGAVRQDDVLGRVAHAVDSTTPGPASRPVPRSSSMPLSASQRSCPASE